MARTSSDFCQTRRNRSELTKESELSITVDSPGFATTSFWRPKHLILSAWLEHAPFAFWLLDATRPRVVVELGTHTGFSFFVFAEGAKRLGLSTRLFALDNWVGDDHAGFYPDEVFDSVKRIADQDYHESTELVRGYFADSVDHFEDGSIDLLHIDGRHGYEDVKEDFELYRPKLSDRAVVIFHDTHEFQEGFGVHRFWDELSHTGRSFNFHHGHGLGVFQPGAEAPAEVTRFLAAASAEPEQMRAAYAALGAAVADEYYRSEELNLLREQLTRLNGDVERWRADSVGLQMQLDELHASTSWRATRPLRALRGLRGA